MATVTPFVEVSAESFQAGVQLVVQALGEDSANWSWPGSAMMNTARLNFLRRGVTHLPLYAVHSPSDTETVRITRST